MEARFDLQQTLPFAYKAMYALSASLSRTSLTDIQKALIKIRASQINSCAFCISMHTKAALQAGETPQRIFLLHTWDQTDLFTVEEKALLAITEEVTSIGARGLSDTVYSDARQLFAQEPVAEIIMTAVLINSWNRIALSVKWPIE